MYRCVTNIAITQNPTKDYPLRAATLNFDFVTTFESSDTWKDLTNKGRLMLPKNLYYTDQTGRVQPLHGTNINIGGFIDVPLFLRGDKVLLTAGYKYYDKAGVEVVEDSVIFDGFISKVHSQIPIELELEDNMWLLKQTPAPTYTFSDTDTLENILATLLVGTPFTYKALTSTTFGEFQIGNESVAQVLQRMQKTYGFEFYFKRNELRGGMIIYIESEAQTQIFRFQQNIISDDLQYMRKDDIVLSALAHNTIVEDTGKMCKDGTAKTKHTRLEVLVTIKNGVRVDTVINKGDTIPENIEGERRTFFFPGAKTVTELADLAYDKLIQYYYTGLRGTFTTFLIPFVSQGDNADIKDPILPERDGVYKIKSVEYTGGVNGGRQTIHLDYKLAI